MIGYLRGKILEHTDGKMLVCAGPSDAEGAVGYAVTVPQSAAYGAHAAGNSIELFVYTHVREDALDLYGFSSRLEKDLFLTLLSVNGIGPKGALGILSGAETSDLLHAILEKDKDFLTRIPGIGKKTAERVVVELSDSLRKKVEAGQFAELRQGAASKRPAGAESALKRPPLTGGAAVIRDAKDALVGLGYREQDVLALLNRLVSEAEAPPTRPEDLIRTALRQL